MKNGELYDSPFFSFSGGRIRSGGLCICLPSALSACIGLCLPSALFVCVCLCLCQVCLSAAPCLRLPLSVSGLSVRSTLSACLSEVAICVSVCRLPLSVSGLSVRSTLSACLSEVAICVSVCRLPLSVSGLSVRSALSACLFAVRLVCLRRPVFCPIPLSGALCAPSSGGRNGRWRRLRSRGPMPKGGP